MIDSISLENGVHALKLSDREGWHLEILLHSVKSPLFKDTCVEEDNLRSRDTVHVCVNTAFLINVPIQ